LLPTKRNKFKRGPVGNGKVGNVDYKVEMASGKPFHINMLKYNQREATDDKKQNKSNMCNTRLPQLHV